MLYLPKMCIIEQKYIVLKEVKRKHSLVLTSERPKPEIRPIPKFWQFRYRPKGYQYRYRKRLHTETDTETDTER